MGAAGRARHLLLAAQLGFARGVTHPAAHLHQVEIDKGSGRGVGVDINSNMKPQFGQWALRLTDQ